MDHPSSSAVRRLAVPEKLYPYVLASPRQYGKSGAAPPPLNLEFLSSLQSSLAYTSLRDVLPGGAALSSPTALTPNSAAYEISIRNRLVKQAAWAYLQPMSASPSCSGNGYFHRLRCRFSGTSPVTACLRFIRRNIFSVVTRVIDGMLRMIRVRH